MLPKLKSKRSLWTQWWNRLTGATSSRSEPPKTPKPVQPGLATVDAFHRPAIDYSRAVSPGPAPALEPEWVPTSQGVDVRLGHAPRQANQVVLLGDSQLFLARPHLLSQQPQLTVHAEWGQTIPHFVALLDPNNQETMAAELQAEVRRRSVVTIHLGGNDISSGATAEQVISRIKELIASARSLNPKVRVAVADVPWRYQAFENPPEWLKEQMEEAQTTPLERQRVLEQVNLWIAKGGDGDIRFSRIPINRWIGATDPRLAAQTDYSPHATDLQKTDWHNVVAAKYQQATPDVHLNDAGYQVSARAILKRLFSDQ